MTGVILALNAGSSSIKFSLFVPTSGMNVLSLLYQGEVKGILSEQRMDVPAVTDLLYHRSGLLGVSGISGDMRELLASDSPHAVEAIDLFVYHIGRELGSLVAALGGLDVLVFTAGIGEHAVSIRKRVCQDAHWLGVQLDEAANGTGGPKISAEGGAVLVWVIPTDEDLMIARHTNDIIHITGKDVTMTAL